MKPLLALLLIALPAAPLLADPRTALERMAGIWGGTGQARSSVNRPLEPIRCRMTATWQADARSLTVDGLCALSGRRVTLAGDLQADPAGPGIGGRWRNPDGPGSAPVTGTQTADGIGFSVPVTNQATGQTAPRLLDWTLDRQGLRLTIGDAAATLATIDFVRGN